MKKTRHTDSQIISILKQNESGTSVAVNMVRVKLAFINGAHNMAGWTCR
jgi:hypothetical protein